MSTQDYIQAAKSIFAAFMRGDMGDFVAAMAEDVVFVSDPGTDEIPWHGIRHGREEVRAHLDLVNENLQVDVLDQSDFLTSEHKVAVVSRMEGSLKKNGEKVIFPELIQILTFDTAGKVTRWSDVYDGTALVAAFRR